MRRALAIALAFFAVLVVGTAATGSVQSLITGANIKDGSIGSNDIKPGAIQSHDIQNGTIGQVDLSKILLTQLQGVTGSQGAKGETGANGANGATGATGATGAKGDTGAVGPKGDTGQQGPVGSQGPVGPRGSPCSSGITKLEADGPYPGRADQENNLQGDQGAQSTTMWSGNGLQQSWVMCAPGKVALGGGFGQDDVQTDQLIIVTSAPTQIVGGALVYSPIGGDAAGSFVPNGWLIQGYNKSGQDLIVRPWVICAKLNQ